MSNKTPGKSIIWLAFSQVGRNSAKVQTAAGDAGFLLACASSPDLDISERHDSMNCLSAFMVNRAGGSLGPPGVEKIAMHLLSRGVDPFENIAIIPKDVHAVVGNNGLGALPGGTNAPGGHVIVCPLAGAYAGDMPALLRAMLALPAAPTLDGFRSQSGLPWLHTALQLQRQDTVEVLVEHGVDVNQRDYRGRTPLFYCRSAAAVDLLLAAGADPVVVDNNGHECIATWGAFPATQDMLSSIRSRHGAPVTVAAHGIRLSLVRGRSDALHRKRLPPADPDNPYTSPVALLLVGCILEAIEGAWRLYDKKILNRLRAIPATTVWSKEEEALRLLLAVMVSTCYPSSATSLITGLNLPGEDQVVSIKPQQLKPFYDSLRCHASWHEVTAQMLPAILDELDIWSQASQGCQVSRLPALGALSSLAAATTVLPDGTGYMCLLRKLVADRQYAESHLRSVLDGIYPSGSRLISLPDWLNHLGLDDALVLLHATTAVFTAVLPLKIKHIVGALASSISAWSSQDAQTFASSPDLLVLVKAAVTKEELLPIVTALASKALAGRVVAASAKPARLRHRA